LSKFIGKAGLWLLTAGIVTLVAVNSLLSRRRMSHDNGLVCKGKLRILNEPDIPPSDFFQPGREFPCRMRHASVSFADDARLVVRSASLKLSDTAHESPLDIMMNTGTEGPFQHAWDFLVFMIATIRGRESHVRPYLKANPPLAEGIQKSICYPDTFALLNYHSKTAMGYQDSNGKGWYIKFKLTPWDRGPDRGRPTEEELTEFWLQDIKPDEKRSRNFLKDEYIRRIEEGPVKYHLQAQFHEVIEGEDREILNCGKEWDENIHPWRDLAELEVDQIMATEEGNLTWYDVLNHPGCMSIPEARSVTDPASVNYLRAKDGLAKKARMQGYKWWGQLPPLVDDRSSPKSAISQICLTQNEPAESVQMRSNELITKRDIYVFDSEGGIPPHARHLPECENFTTHKTRGMVKSMCFGLLNGVISGVETCLRDRKSLKVFDRYYPLWHEPKVISRFGSDLEFGRQRVNGLNPVLVKRCTHIPDNFPVTEETVAGLLDKKDSLEKARASNRLYILDHHAVGGFPVKNGYLAVPITLFYINKKGQFLPLAIQLEQVPGPRAPIFTPKDPYWLWTTVKTYVQAADACYHEVASHLLRTHFVMEAFSVAAHRQLHVRHPVHQLLAPHFHATMAINNSARAKMLGPGGPIDKTLSLGCTGSMELLRSEYAQWDFSLCDFPKDIKDRGLDDTEAMPHNFYRDDGLQVWDIISRFVSKSVDFWYSESDAEIAADTELQAWFAELASADAGNVRGLPEGGSASNRETLKIVLTRVIFTCTAEHSSVNNGQYEMFGYPPNVPGSMYKPWPTSKDDPLSEEDFVSRLPNHSKSAAQMWMVYLLSQPTRYMVGDFEKPYFHACPNYWKLVREFRGELEKLSNQIGERNKGLEVPYEYMDPRQIGESIAI
jgi:hypothetical protein